MQIQKTGFYVILDEIKQISLEHIKDNIKNADQMKIIKDDIKGKIVDVFG